MMKELFEHHFATSFLLMWLSVTTLLSLLSGWFYLMIRYPDQNDEAIFKITFQSGKMGLLHISMERILTLSACRSGLRIGMFRLFGPFNRDIFIPWKEIIMKKKKIFFFDYAELKFGNPSVGNLIIEEHIANRFVRFMKEGTTEIEQVEKENTIKIFHRVLKRYLLQVGFVFTFFMLAPLIMGEKVNFNAGNLVISFFFPAIVFGIYALYSYWKQSSDLKK